MILYLDIDGSLILTSERHLASKCELGLGCLQFLQYATQNYDCRWLSFHARKGFTNNVSRVFRQAIGVHTLPKEWNVVLDRIQPAPWCSHKTDGIDFTTDFYWLDDAASEYDQKILAERRMSNRLIKVHLNHFASDLYRVREILDDVISSRASETA